MTILTLQKAVRTGQYETFKTYSARVDAKNKRHTLRGLLDWNTAGRTPIPLAEVERCQNREAV